MTFTVLARDPRSGLIGAATASRSLAVGNAVLGIRPGVGAVASQAWTNRALRGLLIDELAAGTSAAAAVARVPDWDDSAELRQVAVLPAAGAGAARTGREVTDWAGHVADVDAVVAGNLLTGPDVLTAMLAALEGMPEIDVDDPAGPARFARTLAAALTAGERAGGDARGRQSAAVLVACADRSAAPGHGDRGDIRVDLRVDDHTDPLAELIRLVDLRGHDLAESVSARTE